MGIHLIGGGWAEDESTWTGEFVAEARERAGGAPRIMVVLWAETAADGERWHQDYRDDLGRLGAGEVRIVQLSRGVALDGVDPDSVDGLFVGGGLTPGYHESIMPAADAIRAAVAAGVPYAGLSAGAMIAGRRALLGGCRIGGVEVCRQDAAEGLDEVTLAPGLGLVEPVVDVHVAQYGLLSRVVATVQSGLADHVVGVDECTSLIVPADGLDHARVTGLGHVWTAERAGDGVTVHPRARGPLRG